MYKTWNGGDCLAYVLTAQLINEKHDQLMVKLNFKDKNEKIIKTIETRLTNASNSESNMFRAGHINMDLIAGFVKVEIESVSFLNTIKEKVFIDKNKISINDNLTIESEEIAVVLS